MFNIAISIATLLISGAIALTFVVPQYREITMLRAKGADLDNALAYAKEIDAISKDLSEKIRAFSADDLARLDRFLPLTFDAPRFAHDLQGIAEKNGVIVREIFMDGTSLAGSPAPARAVRVVSLGAKPGYATHSVKFTATSSYGNFISFLEELERSLQFVDFTSLALRQPSVSVAAGRYDYEIELATYSLKP